MVRGRSYKIGRLRPGDIDLKASFGKKTISEEERHENRVRRLQRLCRQCEGAIKINVAVIIYRMYVRMSSVHCVHATWDDSNGVTPEFLLAIRPDIKKILSSFFPSDGELDKLEGKILDINLAEDKLMDILLEIAEFSTYLYNESLMLYRRLLGTIREYKNYIKIELIKTKSDVRYIQKSCSLNREERIWLKKEGNLCLDLLKCLLDKVSETESLILDRD